ncbi:MAG TPA: M15 family metallopeptidase [bacterium]|jgi:hypothetical protein
MAADLQTLIPEFRAVVEALIAACTARRVEMRPYFAVRSPFAQARLWRQSRATEEIQQKIADLEEGGAPFLAHCIASVGPQNGARVTNAPPGFSWHQWGEAVDCFWVVDGGAEWSTRKEIAGVNGYRVYAEEAAAFDLDPGGYWRSMKDWPHVQLRAVSHPGKVMSLAELDAGMAARFGG